MSQALAAREDSGGLIEQVIIKGDLAKLTPGERVQYYKRVCESIGLNPFTQPLGYLNLSGKLVLYAKKDAGEQLRKLNSISVYKIEKEQDGDLFVVTAYAKTPDGREDIDMGAVSIKNLNGDALVNAKLKAITKAKRRVTLSICGLGFLDETEIETVAEARPTIVTHEGEIVEEKPPQPKVMHRDTMLAQIRETINQLTALGHPTFKKSDVEGERGEKILKHLRDTAARLEFDCDAKMIESGQDLTDDELRRYGLELESELSRWRDDLENNRVF